jgi:hypothetical protein
MGLYGATVCLFVGLLLFGNSVYLHAAGQDRLRDAIYKHNKTVLEINRDKYGTRLQPEDFVVDNTYSSALVDLNDDKLRMPLSFSMPQGSVDQAAAAWKSTEAPKWDSILSQVVPSRSGRFELHQIDVMAGKRSSWSLEEQVPYS